MDFNVASTAVNTQLAAMDAVTVNDQASAHRALAHVVTATALINQTLDGQTTPVAEPNLAGGLPGRLEEWIGRLYDKLTEIVANLIAGTSFSITAGTGITVTITFPPPVRAAQ